MRSTHPRRCAARGLRDALRPAALPIVHCGRPLESTEAGGERGFDGGKQLKGRKRQMVVDTAGNLLTVAVDAADMAHV